MPAGISWAACALLVCGIAAATPAAAMPPNFADVLPSPQQVRWQDLEFGVIVHFGTNTSETFVSCRVCSPDATF
jgi:alpha-L-fucosidase